MYILRKSVVAILATVMIFAGMLFVSACGEKPAPKIYTVTFEYNKSVAGQTTSTSEVEEGKTVTPPTVISSGYIFDGWFTDNNTFANQFNFSTPITQNLTLYGKWSIDLTSRLAFLNQLDTNDAGTPPTYNHLSYTNKKDNLQNQSATITNGTITLGENIVNVKMTRSLFESLYITGCEMTLENYNVKADGSMYCGNAFTKGGEEFLIVMYINAQNYVTSVAYSKYVNDSADEIYWISNCVYSNT